MGVTESEKEGRERRREGEGKTEKERAPETSLSFLFSQAILGAEPEVDCNLCLRNKDCPLNTKLGAHLSC